MTSVFIKSLKIGITCAVVIMAIGHCLLAAEIRGEMCRLADEDGRLAPYVRKLIAESKLPAPFFSRKFYEGVICEGKQHLLHQAIEVNARKNIDFLIFEARIPLDSKLKNKTILDWIKNYKRLCDDDDVCWEHLIDIIPKLRNPVAFLKNYLKSGKDFGKRKYYQEMLEKAQRAGRNEGNWGAKFGIELSGPKAKTSLLAPGNCTKSGMDCFFL